MTAHTGSLSAAYKVDARILHALDRAQTNLGSGHNIDRLILAKKITCIIQLICLSSGEVSGFEFILHTLSEYFCGNAKTMRDL